MSGRTPVLGDHKRVKSKLITPFNDLLGPTLDVSWINTMIPELLWMALLHDAYGDHRAVEVVTSFTRALRAHTQKFSGEVFAAAGKFSDLPEGALQAIMAGLDTSCADAVRTALAPLVAWYPAHPLNEMYGNSKPEPELAMLQDLRRVVGGMYDRSERATIMVQATAIWLAFDSGRLKVAADLSLASFPEIQDYPTTELSQRIGASIRASLNQMFGEGQMMASDGRWPIAFWNRGLQLEPCELNDD
jgi:hypothetical protein